MAKRISRAKCRDKFDKIRAVTGTMKKIFTAALLSILVLAGCSTESKIASESAQSAKQATQVAPPGNTAPAAAPQKAASSDSYSSGSSIISGRWVTVTSVSDGDTVEVNGSEKVRLIGINTPETVKPNSPVQPYGKEASQFSKTQLLGKKVFLEQDVQTTDKYGRTLAYLFLQEPRNANELESLMFNATLLREGYAQLMTIPPNVKYTELFLRLQRVAREQNKGLWGLGIYKDNATSTANVYLPGKDPAAGSTAAVAKTPSPPAVASKNCSNPTIKGNINSKGEKIYHVPGGQFYTRTNAEEMFCTEEQARAAGYRKSLR